MITKKFRITKNKITYKKLFQLLNKNFSNIELISSKDYLKFLQAKNNTKKIEPF